MLYDKTTYRDCRKQSLTEPNPTKVGLSSATNFLELQIAKQFFFQNIEGTMMLGDSQGTINQV